MRFLLRNSLLPEEIHGCQAKILRSSVADIILLCSLNKAEGWAQHIYNPLYMKQRGTMSKGSG